MNNGLAARGRGRSNIYYVISIIPIILFTLLLLLANLGCSVAQDKIETPAFVATHIYFGRNIPAGGEISEEQLASFLETVVTPAFPLGLTAYDAYGQMQTSEGKIVRQKTKVLLLVHDNSKTNVDAIHKITAAFRSKFGNPQVMVITAAVTPEFYGN